MKLAYSWIHTYIAEDYLAKSWAKIWPIWPMWSCSLSVTDESLLDYDRKKIASRAKIWVQQQPQLFVLQTCCLRCHPPVKYHIIETIISDSIFELAWDEDLLLISFMSSCDDFYPDFKAFSRACFLLPTGIGHITWRCSGSWVGQSHFTNTREIGDLTMGTHF